MSLGPFEPHASDLAPGDRGVLDDPWSAFTVERIRSTSDPLFDEAYGRLWREFGERGEMERRDVIAGRLDWNPGRRIRDHALMYEILVLRDGNDIVAVRDHTVIVPPAALAGGSADVVVHLSHVLVEPAMRGRGLAAWLRALPVESARRAFELARGESPTARRATGAAAVTLVAEMEHDDGITDAVRMRLRSYARAGFRMVDPSRIAYSQPDFRSEAEIDRSSVQAVPLCLVLRRVGREHENSIAAQELRKIVEALYVMFGVHVRDDHMQCVRELLRLPDGDEQIALVLPQSASPVAGSAPSADRRVIR